MSRTGEGPDVRYDVRFLVWGLLLDGWLVGSPSLSERHLTFFVNESDEGKKNNWGQSQNCGVPCHKIDKLLLHRQV